MFREMILLFVLLAVSANRDNCVTEFKDKEKYYMQLLNEDKGTSITDTQISRHCRCKVSFSGTFYPHFQKKCFIRSQVCLTAPNQSALESANLGALNGGSNFEIQPHGADLTSFEAARLPKLEIN